MELRIARIVQMEACFNRLQSAVYEKAERSEWAPTYREDLETLLAYYESGLWLEDYTADEQGLLPGDLQRGVLSQDGVYNLLFELEQWRRGETL